MSNPGSGTGVEGNDDDMLGPNGENLMYRPFLAGVNKLAKAGQAAGNLAASFNPIANGITAVSGQNPDGSCASKWDRFLAGVAVVGDGLGALGEWGGDLLRALRKGCFVAGTPVQMADGSAKPIEQVQVGDLVLSRDQDAGADGAVVASRVVHVYQHDHPSARMVMVTLSSGERIVCTDEHPFFVPGDGWVAAGKLCTGTQVTPRAGPKAVEAGVAGVSAKVTVVSVAPLAAKAGSRVPVYNLEVAGTHTYFVGNTGGGEWVHNQCRLRPTKVTIPDGNVNGGWQHILERHIDGTQPGGDLFPVGTTRQQLEDAANQILRRGQRISSDPSQAVQTFQERLTINGVSGQYRVVIHIPSGRVISIFPFTGTQ